MNRPLNPSIWEGSASLPGASPLRENLVADCCVVGAGIAGMSVAYRLATFGMTVIMLEARSIGSGETGHTTAHLSNAIDARYHEMIRIHGLENARKIAQSHTAAIAQIEQIVREEAIDCDFRRVNGYLFAASDADNDELEQEWQAARKAGLDVRKTGPAPVIDQLNRMVLLFPGQAQFHPLKYLEGLRTAFCRRGGRIFEQSAVREVSGGEHAFVRTAEGQTVRARHLVITTNTPFNDRFEIHTKQAPYRSYAIAAEIPKGSVPPALYWDTAEPYHYARIQPGEAHDFVIVGGEDHKTGQQDDASERFGRLEQWARAHFPMMQKVCYRWSGQVLETMDGIAFIGKNPMDAENVNIATGDCGMGMTHGTLAGMLIADRIMDRPNPWAALYDPARRRVGALGRFTRENLNVAACYADLLSPGDIADEEALMPGSGAVIRRGLKKYAVYCDDDGALHTCSAVCPHMKCVVHWNSLEKTWDCPCHGSRFSATGEVINGPAVSNLTPIRSEDRHTVSQ